MTSTTPRMFISGNISCCRDCKDRHVGCHSDCAAYAAGKRKLEAEKERMRSVYLTERIAETDTIETKIRLAKRARRGR